jgi:hypothetical protein
MEARVGEVDVALVVEVEVVGEVEPHALGFRGERRGQPALGADLEQAEVGVGDVEVPGAAVEADPEGAAADVLIGEVVQRRRPGPTAGLLGPARGRGGEGRPPRAVPERDPPVGDARVGSAAPRVERHALGPLHVAAEPVRGVGVPRHLVGAGEVHGVRLEAREIDHAAPPQRVRAASTSAADTTPGDAIPFSRAWVCFSEASKQALQLEGVGMVVSLSEGEWNWSRRRPVRLSDYCINQYKPYVF